MSNGVADIMELGWRTVQALTPALSYSFLPKKKFMGTNLINVKTFGFFVSLFIIKIVFEYYYTFSNFNAYKILELILFYQIQYISVQ